MIAVMLFKDTLYSIESSERSADSARYRIRLNAEHAIYRAHFPGEPITPGVCILQMALELLSDAVGGNVALANAKNVKYLSILRPDGVPVDVTLTRIEDTPDGLKAQIAFQKEETPVAKLSLLCRRIAE